MHTASGAGEWYVSPPCKRPEPWTPLTETPTDPGKHGMDIWVGSVPTDCDGEEARSFADPQQCD